jgi:outer membrane protein assembly factor BamA
MACERLSRFFAFIKIAAVYADICTSNDTGTGQRFSVDARINLLSQSYSLTVTEPSFLSALSLRAKIIIFYHGTPIHSNMTFSKSLTELMRGTRFQNFRESSI